MDPHLIRGFTGSTNGIQLRNQYLSVGLNQNLEPEPRYGNREFHQIRPGLCLSNIASSSSNMPSSSSVSHEEDSQEDCDFSNIVLRYISQMLMEEEMDDKTCMLQDSLDLQAAEKSFYEVLGQKYPPSSEENPYISQYSEVPDDNFSGNCISCLTTSHSDDNRIEIPGEGIFQITSPPVCRSSSLSSYNSSNGIVCHPDRLVESLKDRNLWVPRLDNGNQTVWQVRKGVEEPCKFLSSGNGLFHPWEVNGLSTENPRAEKLELEEESSSCGSRARKNLDREDDDPEEERSNKQAAVFAEPTLRSEMFDIILLWSTGKGLERLTKTSSELKSAKNKKPILESGNQPQGSNGRKNRGKKRNVKKEVVDLRTLLITCAQAVAADDRKNANELLRQIRQHSSPFGDGNQRLAHSFANGLEARLAGSSNDTQIYKGLISIRPSAADLLKAYHLYIAACPFRRISHFTSNKTIMNIAANSTRLHVIDFGILYGFQWPTLIQRISWRSGGPPRLKITGIEFPQPGFRPAERVEETGRRLTTYAETFKVPFEYHAVAKNWETIQLEDLKIDKDEVLVVNCLYRGKNLLDESVAVDSPRKMFLDLVRKINPDLFIHGITNGAYNAPFFVTRFREALFHFSAMFDMLETVVPREDQERMLIEKEILGREALNVIACEGWERVERPETYKHWQVRIMRAGFVQIPFDRDIVKTGREKVRMGYHKDFVIDEDSRWVLQGWKGRTIYALSAWKPFLLNSIELRHSSRKRSSSNHRGGSKPEPPSGLQRQRRQAVRAEPLTVPYFL